MLGEIQQQLEKRFAELAAERRRLNYPVYAIEHGLEEADLVTSREAASQSIRYRSPSDAHWLVWAVLAAEAGYGYSGDEYWPALEVQPGEWRSNDHRQALRRFFQRFAREFGGPAPTGRWADHFSIIAWPITHAILPRYLQSHFARHLYDLRFDLPRFVAGSGEGLGTFLLKEYDGTSSRFRDFLQQTGLTAQIVLALRDEDMGGQAARIEPALLGRIVSDLERRPEARSYLRDARKLIQATAIHISPRLQPTNGTRAPAGASGSATPQRPRLVARRQASGGFLLGLQLPDIRLALKHGGVETALLNGPRVRFAGDDERPMPASNLLTLSRRERRLSAFPASGSPSFIVEDGPQALMHVLDPISRIEERACWVLRRQVDGLYREVLGGHVRAGQEYLLLSRTKPEEEAIVAAGLIPANVETAGVEAFRLSTPARLENARKAVLERLCVGTITGVSIEPVGLTPAPPSSGGLPTWRSIDPVTLRLRADFDVDAFLVAIDGQQHQDLPCPGGELFLQLDHMEPGRHSVGVSVRTRDGKPSRSEAFDFEVITPRPWVAAMREKAGFRLFAEPDAGKIEQLFDGRASLHIVGPAGRNVQWSLETYDAAGHFARALPIGTAKVGSQQSTLRSMLARARNEHAPAIDEAYRIDLVASLEELGRQALSFPHAVEPLRWKFDVRAGTVRLIDETDHTEPVTIREYPLKTPLAGRSVDLEAGLSGYAVAAPGSLLVATRKKQRVAIFVSVPGAQRLHDLTDLGFSQSMTAQGSPDAAVIRLIDSLRRWERAKAVGHLGPVRQATTLEKLRAEIADVVCGREFAADLRSSHPKSFERAQRKVGGSPGFGMRMRTYAWPATQEAAQAGFDDFASTYGVERDPRWCRAALTLAYNPLFLRIPEGIDSREYFTQLLGRRVLLRGAFLANAASRAAHAPLRATA